MEEMTSNGKRKAVDESWIEYAGGGMKSLVSDAVASSTYYATPILLPPSPLLPASSLNGRAPPKKKWPAPPPNARVLDKSCARCRIRKGQLRRIVSFDQRTDKMEPS